MPKSSRLRGVRPTKNYGQIADEAVMWLNLGRVSFTLFDNPWNDDGSRREHSVVRMVIQFPGIKRATTLNLTGLTIPELEKIKEFFTKSFDRAEPICEALDELAKGGEDVYYRSYRTVPILVERERNEREHDPSVQGGPDGVVELADNTAPEDTTG